MDWRDWAYKYKEDNDITYRELTNLVNIKFDMEMSYDAIRKAVYRRSERLNDSEGNMTLNNLQEEIEVSEDSCEGHRSTEDIMVQLGYDPKSWKAKKSTTTIKKNGDKTQSYTKVDVVPANELETVTLDELNKQLDKLMAYVPSEIKASSSCFNLLKIIPISDLHLNLLADIETSGNEYNISIACDRFKRTIADNIADIKGKDIEKILLVVGNDFINADNLQGTTTKGTPQDNEVNWFKATDVATQLIIDAVHSLLKIAPVEVLNVTSNHDLHSMYSVCRAVHFAFRGNDEVTVLNKPCERFYYEYGKIGFCFSHDMKDPKKNALPIISSEFKHKWSDMNNCYLILGHLHNEMKYEKVGNIEIYRLPTCSGWSRWANTMGYRNNYLNQSFLVDPEWGIIDEHYTKFK